MSTVLLATGNAHKVIEVRAILAEVLRGRVPSARIERNLVGLAGYDVPEVIESGVTFEENALLKARAATESTGLPALSDDSGLCVDVLGGAPGIFSARWSGQHGQDRANLELLLAQLRDVPPEHRQASFVAAVALVLPDGRSVVTHGRVAGTLAQQPAGVGGFGYDPIMRPDGYDCTMAELTADQKNSLSHRSRALRALADDLEPLL